jgi:hypothetical protein
MILHSVISLSLLNFLFGSLEEEQNLVNLFDTLTWIRIDTNVQI